MQGNVDKSEPAPVIQAEVFDGHDCAAEHAAFVADLVRMVEAMIPEGASGAEGFDASRWFARWLDQPQPALGGNSPKSYLDAADGRTMVRGLLGQIESGAYA